MANNYNVDDILAEVMQKKTKLADEQQQGIYGKIKPSEEPKPTVTPPFRMAGLTDEFEPPKSVGNSERHDSAGSLDGSHTRVDIPVRKPSPDFPESSSSTLVIPSAKTADDDLEKRRQEKIKQFMMNSFASTQDDEQEPEEDEPQEEAEIGSIAQFFGGLKSSASAVWKEKSDELSAAKPKPAAVLNELDEDEYNSPSDAQRVRRDILDIKRILSTRTLITGGCFIVLLYLAFCNLYPLPLLNAICPEVDMRWFLIINLVFLFVSAIVSNAVIGSGLISLFTFNSDHDTPAALCTLAVIAHGVSLIVQPDKLAVGDGGFFFCIAALTLFTNAVGKRMMAVRIERNFSIASIDATRTGEYMLKDDAFSTQLTEGQGFESPALAYPAKVDFPDKFLSVSYSDEYSENLGKITTPLFLLFGAVLGIISCTIFDLSAMEAFGIFCAVICMSSPLTTTMIGNFPLLRAANKLTESGAFISGYEAIEQFEDLNSVALDSTDLYPSGSVVLHGIKAFAKSRIDEAIVDAASVMCKADGLLKDIFLDMIGNKPKLLKQVDSIEYYDQQGISAKVNRSVVLIGNRDLMSANNIVMPSLDYEQKFIKEGQDILYLANSGEVVALFVLGYKPSNDMRQQLARMAKKDFALIVKSIDPNITESKIAEDYGYPKEFIKIIPAALHGRYERLTAPREKDKAYIMSLAGAPARLRALLAAQAVKQSIMLSTILQLIGLILGYAIVAFLAFSGTVHSISFLSLIIYQLFWCAAVLFIGNSSKI